MGWQLGMQVWSHDPGPRCPIRTRQELVEGVPKNLEQNRDSCHPGAIRSVPWAPSQGRVNYPPPSPWVTALEMSKADSSSLCPVLPGKTNGPRPKLGSSAEMWNFPGKLQNQH